MLVRHPARPAPSLVIVLRDDTRMRFPESEPRSKAFVAIITCADRARHTHLVSRHTAITPGIARAGDSIPAKGLGKSMNSVYALIYIVAAAVVVTVAFLVVTALTP